MSNLNLIEILSPVALIALVWGITQFFLKRRYDKADRNRIEKKETLTNYLLKLNDISGVIFKIQNESSKRIALQGRKLSTYRSRFNTIYENEGNPDLQKLNFINFDKSTKENFLKKTVELFKDQETINIVSLELIENLHNELENYGILLRKESLITLYGNKKIFDNQYQLIKLLDNFTTRKKVLHKYEELQDDILVNLKLTHDILVECYNLEFQIISELKNS